MAEASTKLGRVSLVPRGAYDAAATYNRLDIVEYEGSSYLVLADGITGVTPEDGASYMLVAERGKKGDPGDPGDPGTPGGKGDPGEKGDPGVGIQSIAHTGGDGSPGTTDTYTITLTNGSTSTFSVYNGADGTSFTILGRYDTLEALKAAHPTGTEGDAWAVGSATDNDIYLWDVDTAAWTNIGSLQGPPGPAGQDGADGGPGPAGADGSDGANGATFTPAVSSDGVLSFTNDGGLPNPDPVNIKGEPGTPGGKGDPGTPGTDGKTAYQYAVDGGYTGTEGEFQALMGTGPWLPLAGGEVTGEIGVFRDSSKQAGVSISTQGADSNRASGIVEFISSADSSVLFIRQDPDTGNVVIHPFTGTNYAATGTAVNIRGVKDPVLAVDAVNLNYFNTHALTVASNAGAHNSIFRGKNLGTSVTAAQYAAIAAGTFDDLFVGDYWVINGINWRIAAFDYYLGTGSNALTTHHAVIVPDTNLDTQKMNDTNTTTGGYAGSKMYTANMETAVAKIKAAFPNHVNGNQFYISNAVTNGKVTGSTTAYLYTALMSERNVYGQTIMSSECANGSDNPGWYTYDRTQFPLFALAPEFIQKQRSTYWLRDVVSASSFAHVSTDGISDWYNAGYSCGVRPAFSIS